MSNPALWTAVGGVVVAVTALVRLFLHTHGPQHK